MPRLTHCPNCDASLEPGAILCVGCGYHVKSGRQLKTRAKRVRHDFGSTPITPWRYYPAIGLTGLGAILCILCVVLSQTEYRDHEGIGFGIFAGIALLITPFLLGYGNSVSVTRNKKGEPVLIKNTWICFRPIGSNTLYLDDWDGIYFEYWLDGNDYPRYRLKLGRDRRNKFFTVYLGGDEDQMKDIADAIKELTGMPFERL